MLKLIAIARNTFREAIRDKILYAILIFALLMLFVALLMGELTLGEAHKVTKDLGLTAISLFGVLIAIFTGVSLVHKEIEKKTLYTIISKPIFRFQFIIGKYFGMLFTAFVQVVVLTLLFTALILYQEKFYDWNSLFSMYKAIYLYWLEISLVISIALFFSSFTTPFFSGFFTFCIFVIGRSMEQIHLILNSPKVKAPVLWFLLKISVILPDFHALNMGHRVANKELIPWNYLVYQSGYVLLYIIIFMVLGMFLFQRRDFI